MSAPELSSRRIEAPPGQPPAPGLARAASLRPYQREALDAVRSAWDEGPQNSLIALPTGTGKTVIFSRIPGFYPERQTLFLAHREELLDQAAAKLLDANPDLRVEIEQAERRASPNTDIVVASVPTIGREGSARIRKFDPGRFGAIVVDEAHHATATTYFRVLEHFGLFRREGKRYVRCEDPRIPLLGVTATPFRGDGVGLDAVFDSIVYQRSIVEMIDEKWLCPVRAFTVRTDTDLDDVHTRGGDFVEAELAEKVNNPLRNFRALAAWRELARERTRTLVFCVDVEHTYDIRNDFRRAGFRADAVLGETPKEERKAILAAFAAGEIQVLCNCGVLLEGYDCPPIDCILMLRPTKSPLLFAQAIGRGTRIAPGKQDLVIIDLVDNSRRHKIVSAASLFGMPALMDLEGKDVRTAKKTLDNVARDCPQLDLETMSSLSLAVERARQIRERMERERERVRAAAQEVRIFKPERLQTPFSSLGWIRMPDGSFQHVLPKDLLEGRTYAVIRPNLLGHWEGIIMPAAEQVGNFRIEAAAFQGMDRWITFHFPDIRKLTNPKARWRTEPATPQQLEQLERLTGQKPYQGMSKGAASDALNVEYAKRNLQREGPPSAKMARVLRERGINSDGMTYREAQARIAQIAEEEGWD